MIFVLLAVLLDITKPEEALAIVCPPRPRRAATADERAIIDVIARHYRQFESKEAPQVLMLDALRLQYVLEGERIHLIPDAAIHLELQRRDVPRAVADRLVGELKRRNAAPIEWTLPETPSRTTVRCRDVLGRAFTGQPPLPGLDLTNVTRAVSVSVPAFDDLKLNALVLSSNDLGVMTRPEQPLQLSLLTRDSAGAWHLQWHAKVGGGGRERESAVRPSDIAIFEAVLERFMGDKPVRVVNETRRAPTGPPEVWMNELLNSSFTSVGNLRGRNEDVVSLGGQKIRRAELVPRETMDALDPQRVLGDAPAVVWFTLPGYNGLDTAVVIYTLVQRTDDGYEKGEGSALFKLAGGVWRLQRDDFRLLKKLP